MKKDEGPMLEGDATTVSEDDAQADSVMPSMPDRLALVLAWSKDEPWRIGEVLLLPDEPGAVVWLGRGPNAAGRPAKGMLGQQRPGGLPCPEITTPAISRYQVSFQLTGTSVTANNEGKCPLLRNGTETKSCELVPGDLVQFGKQFLFLCCRRPAAIREVGSAYTPFAFGLPDAHGIVGESPGIWHVRRLMAFAGARRDHVLVGGASGTGKELVATAIHAMSARGGRRMVCRNAATLPETLIDAELFGNSKNYPNPGMADRPGLIGEAHGSTLFLDELSELPHAAQAHLLRVLDHGEYQRLGEAYARVSDFRLIGATNRDPALLKPDLLARLTFRIGIPDLNERKEDVPLLARHLLRVRAEQGDPMALELFPGGDPHTEPRIPLSWMHGLLRHHYRTNVRELATMLVLALATPEVTQAWGRGDDPESQASTSAADSADEPIRARAIRECLDANNGSIEHTWRALGLTSRYSLLRLIKKYGIEVRRHPARGRRPLSA